MKKTFVIQVESPDCVEIFSKDIASLTQEFVSFHLDESLRDITEAEVRVREVTFGFNLVKKMREAQKNYYRDKQNEGTKVAYHNMINKEYLVDEYLKKMEV